MPIDLEGITPLYPNPLTTIPLGADLAMARARQPAAVDPIRLVARRAALRARAQNRKDAGGFIYNAGV